MQFKQYLNEEYWGTLAGGVLVIAADSKRLLVSLRSAHVMQPGTWGIIGGKVDDHDASIQDEVKREFKEETGYTGSINLTPSYVFKDNGFEYHNFIGIIPTEFQPVLDWESSKIEWFTLEELIKLEPKHFGLSALLNHALGQIKRLTN